MYLCRGDYVYGYTFTIYMSIHIIFYYSDTPRCDLRYVFCVGYRVSMGFSYDMLLPLILLCEIVAIILLISVYRWAFCASWLDRIRSIYNSF